MSPTCHQGNPRNVSALRVSWPYRWATKAQRRMFRQSLEAKGQKMATEWCRTISNKGSPLEFFEFEMFVNICEWVSFRMSNISEPTDWPIHLLIHVWLIFGSWIQETPARARWSNRQLAPATQHQDESKWCHNHVQLVSFLKSWVLSVSSRSLFKTSTQHEAA